MKTWDEVCKEALAMYLHSDRYAYFYGAKGQILTDDVMSALIASEKAYFSRYSEEEMKQIRDYSRGKIGYDCSGFVGHLVGCMTYSTALYTMCEHKTTDVYQGPAGSLLYYSGGPVGRHIAIDIGLGFYLHMGREKHSVEMGRFKENLIGWTGSGQLTKYVNYEGADNR